MYHARLFEKNFFFDFIEMADFWGVWWGGGGGKGPPFWPIFFWSLYDMSTQKKRGAKFSKKLHFCHTLIDMGINRTQIVMQNEINVFHSLFNFQNLSTRKRWSKTVLKLPHFRFRSCLNSDFRLKKSKISVFRLAEIAHFRFPPNWETPLFLLKRSWFSM